MKVFEQLITLKTTSRNQMIDITSQVSQAVNESSLQNGTVAVHCPHTTGAITINENADPDVTHDILLTLNELFPHNRPGYRHLEGNSDSHVKSSLVGCSERIILSRGQMVLGTWQGIYFCEFDGPRNRKVNIQIIGE